MRLQGNKFRRAQLAAVLVICMVMTLLEPCALTSKVQAAASSLRKYTLELNNTSLLYFCNETASEGPVTFEYTVEEMTSSGVGTGFGGGFVATTDPNQNYPYGTNGSYQIGSLSGFMTAGTTYQVTLKTGDDGIITYSGNASGLSSDGSPTSTASTYFGIYVQMALTGKITELCCYDADGNDLGVQLANGDASLTEQDDEQDGQETKSAPKKYNLELNNTSLLYLCNKQASSTPVTIEYTVSGSISVSEAQTGWGGGIASTTEPNQKYPYGTKGSVKLGSWNTGLADNTTYQITMWADSDGMIAYSGNLSAITYSESKGSTEATYFGIYVQPALTGKITNISCYDADGNDLGVQVANGDNATLTEQEDKEAPKKYNLELNNTSLLYLCNKQASSTPVTIEYTVSGSISVSEAQTGWGGGIASTTEPNQKYPYETKGSVKLGSWNTGLADNTTYQITIWADSNGMIAYSGNLSAITYSESKGSTEATYFGIYVQPALTGKITNISCYDADGNDLGVQVANGDNATLTEQEAPKKYTIETNNASLLYFCNETASEGPVTFEYTVEAMESSAIGTGFGGGVVATTDPKKLYPYTTNGSYQIGDLVKVMTAGTTYQVTLAKGSDGIITYSGDISGLSSDKSPTSTESTYFGIYLQPALKGKITNISCYDANGNDLGVQLGSGATLTENQKSDPDPEPEPEPDPDPDVDPDCESHTVELDNTSLLYMCNATASKGPVTIEYTVGEMTSQDVSTGYGGGVVATTEPKQMYPYLTNGSYQIGDLVKVMTAGTTYKVTMETGSDGIITYSGTITGLSSGGSPASTKSNYFGIYVQPALTGTLTNVRCYDADGKDLGIQIANGDNVKLDGVPVDHGTDPEPEPEPEPVEQKTPEELGYEKVVLKDFALSDGTYTKSKIYNGLYQGESLNRKYLDVDVTCDPTEKGISDGSFITFAGNEESGWLGVRIVRQEGQFLVWATNPTYQDDKVSIPYSQVGLKEGAASYNMKVGAQLSGDNVIVDFWINDVRAGRMTFQNNAGQHFGKYLGIYANDVDITLSTPGSSASGNTETLPDFQTITLGNFGIADGTYVNTYVEGGYGLRLDKKILSVDVEYGTPGGQLRYGGTESGWSGLSFRTRSGNMYLECFGYVDDEIQMVTDQYVFNSIGAGVQLEGSSYNLKISTEYVDSDGDGKKDDVKLGVWFNDKLYENTYIYLQDYVQHLGHHLLVYSPTTIEYIKVSSAKGVDTGVDYPYFGFTKNWKQELGVK